VLWAVGALVLLSERSGLAQIGIAPQSRPDPYRRIDHFLKLPPGRILGATSAVTVDVEGHIWIADRCGRNNCTDSTLDPIMEFDSKGNFLHGFGAGMFVFPHGIFIDKAGHIWVTDAKAAGEKGNDVLEFDQNGKLLRTLGKPGDSGSGSVTLNMPSAVLVAPNGEIFVADGHEPGEIHAQIVKFDRNGRFIKRWGANGSGPGQFDMPHALAMDSRGRLFVADRGNNRIQIFDREGNLLSIWPQFGRPSGVSIDQRDVLYVTDSESRNATGYGHHPGWPRGIRIGLASDGKVTAFIPDPAPDQEGEDTTGGEGIAVDSAGNIYSAQVREQDIAKYVKR
jgi:DNA-binding beta-propeller fold protein YncE